MSTTIVATDCGGTEESFFCVLYVNGRASANVWTAGSPKLLQVEWTRRRGYRQASREAARVGVTLGKLVALAVREMHRLRGWCTRGTLYRLRGDAPATWRVLGVPFVGREDEVRGRLRGRYGRRLQEIANERFLGVG